MAAIRIPTQTQTGRGIVMFHDFAGKLFEKWKSWLTGSMPMAGLTVTGLVNPGWTVLPLWLWGILIFVAGLLAAMFHVYRELRAERDDLEALLTQGGQSDQFLLVRLCPHGFCAVQTCQRKVIHDDL